MEIERINTKNSQPTTLDQSPSPETNNAYSFDEHHIYINQNEFGNQAQQKIELNDEQKKNFRYSMMGIKLISLILVAFFFLYILNPSNQEHEKDFCIKDNIHDLLEPVNQKFHQNKIVKNSFQIISSFIMDFSFLSVLAIWAFKAKSGSGFVSICAFYGTRAIVQSLFLFRFPKGDIWSSPGIPSVTVPYGLQCDFYFSGHCGCLVLLIKEIRCLGYKKLSWPILMGLPFVAFVLVASRTHYSLDIPIGIMFAYYLHEIITSKSEILDRVARNVFCNKFMKKKTAFLDR